MHSQKANYMQKNPQEKKKPGTEWLMSEVKNNYS